MWYLSRSGQDGPSCGLTNQSACSTLSVLLDNYKRLSSDKGNNLTIATDTSVVINPALMVSTIYRVLVLKGCLLLYVGNRLRDFAQVKFSLSDTGVAQTCALRANHT